MSNTDGIHTIHYASNFFDLVFERWIEQAIAVAGIFDFAKMK